MLVNGIWLCGHWLRIAALVPYVEPPLPVYGVRKTEWLSLIALFPQIVAGPTEKKKNTDYPKAEY